MKSLIIPFKSMPSGRSRWLSWLTTTAAILGLSASAMAQTTILSETLRTGSLPSGWAQTDVTFSTSAGGYANLTTVAATMTTPEIDASAYDSITVNFDVAKFGSGTDGPISVEYSINGGVDWTSAGDSLIPTSSTYVSTSIPIGESGSEFVVRFNRAASPSQKRLRDVVIVGTSSGPDVAPPVPTAFEPASGATNVPINFIDLNTTGAAFVTFNEPITLVGTLPVELRRVSDDFLIEEIPADDFSSMFVGGTNGEELGMFVFEILDYSTEYYISVPAGTVEDAAGNPNIAFGAPASATPWTFTTFAAASLQDAVAYTQDFLGFTADGTLPSGWFAEGPVLGYNGDWGSGFSSGFRGNASVLGYQHTSGTGVLTKGLRLRNDTGAEITELTISYDGRAERLTEGRSPAYVVVIDGVAVPALAYSTAEGDGVSKSASISGLSIAAGASFEITWTSDRDLTASGSSKQIGISNVSVLNAATLFPPTLGVTSVVIGSVTDTGLEVDGDLIADGAAAVTARGFVISETSVNASPEVGGTGVTTLPDATTDLGVFSAMISGLSPTTEYSVRAYATNSQGTAYSNTVTATTLSTPPSFLGQLIENFNGFDGTLADGWTALSSTGANSYAGLWGTGTGSGLRGGVSSPGVLGYQHTGGTGIFTVTLRLKNDTGSTLDQLFVSYLGRVERPTEGRSPEWTVKLNGTEVTQLAYSTASGLDETKSHMITGLSIANGENFTITWESDRGLPAGSSRQIGIASVVVNLDGTLPPPADDFGAWVSGFTGMGSLTGFNDDADFDGIPNGLEHVLGTAPNSADQGSPLAVTSTGTGSITIRHTRIKPADLGSDVLAVYQWSADLATWSGSAETFNGVTVTFGAPVVVDDTDPDFDVIDVTATVTGGSSTKVFVRLGAQQTAP